MSYLLKQNLAIAWPLMANAVLLQSMVVIDVMLVAPLGDVYVAALGLASTLVFFFLGIQMALANGTQLILARCFGANAEADIRSNVYCGLALNVGLSLIFMLFLLFGVSHVLTLLKFSSDVTIHTLSYLSIAAFYLPLTSASQVLISLYNSAKKTKVPLQGLFLEIPINIVSSYILIYGVGSGFIGVDFDGFGIAGAASGSLLASFCRLMYLYFRLSKRLDGLKLRIALPSKVISRSNLSKTIDQQRRHFSEASPIAANYVTLSTGIMIYQLLFASLSVTEYAAIVLIMPWIRIGGQVGTSWGQATSIQVSRLIGEQRQYDMPLFIKDAVRMTWLAAACVSIMFLGFVFLVEFIYPTIHADTLNALYAIAPIFVLLPLVRVFNTVVGQTLRSLGQSLFVFKVHVTTQWLAAIPLCGLLIWMDAPIVWVFSMLFFEELLKTPFFLRNIQKTHVS